MELAAKKCRHITSSDKIISYEVPIDSVIYMCDVLCQTMVSVSGQCSQTTVYTCIINEYIWQLLSSPIIHWSLPDRCNFDNVRLISIILIMTYTWNLWHVILTWYWPFRLSARWCHSTESYPYFLLTIIILLCC